MKEVRRLIHRYIDALTSANGFMELALGESDRKRQLDYIKRAHTELKRAIGISHNLRLQIEAKASQYGEGLQDEV